MPNAPNVVVPDGHLSFIDPAISTDTRSVLLRAVADNPRRGVRPGLYVRVRVDLSVHPAALVVPWYIGVAVVTALSSAVLNGGRVVPGNTRQLFIQHPHGLGILVLALLATAIAAPLCEEAFFRGMLFRLLRRRFPLWTAVLLSALAFGLAHASPTVSFALLPVFVYMGIVLAVVYARTGSLTNTVLLHSLNNAVGTVTVFFLLSR